MLILSSFALSPRKKIVILQFYSLKGTPCTKAHIEVVCICFVELAYLFINDPP